MAEPSEQQHGKGASRRDLLVALVHGSCSAAVVRATLDVVERDPLASAGCFRGDLLRGLMELDGSFWGQHPLLYDRYRTTLRTAAAVRRRLPPGERMEFWSLLDRSTVSGERPGHAAPPRSQDTTNHRGE